MLDTESNRIEYKREIDKSDKLEKAVVSFLNYNGGGEILVGVADDGSVAEVSDPYGAQLKIADRLVSNIRPKILGLFDVVVEKIEGKNIIRVVVSGGTQKPYYIRRKGMTEEGCFIRVGASAQPMTEAMIERLLQRRQVSSLSTTPSSRQKLTFEQLHIYYNEHGLKLNDQFEENLDLRNGDGNYNFLAYLLADNNGASIKVAKYAGKDKVDLIENEEYGYRCLITAIYRVLDKFAVENKTFAKITSRNRLERKLIDEVALKEAFINSVVHNDFTLGWPVVEFFSDRVTITSVGGLVEDLSQEDFFSGRSMLRNRELMRVFKDVELVEGLGSGMQRILEAYDRSAFEITPGFIVATFPYASDFERSVNEDEVAIKDSDKLAIGSDRTAIGSDKLAIGSDKLAIGSDRLAIEISDRNPAILKYLEQNGSGKNADFAKLLAVSPQRVRQILQEMINDNLIEKHGDKRHTYYTAKKG